MQTHWILRLNELRNPFLGESPVSTPVVVVEGMVKEDGTLELVEKVNLPAGKVQVTLVRLSEELTNDSFARGMEAIWAGQKARGHVARSIAEVESERQLVREEIEEEVREAMRLQEECRQARAGV